jgi:hypothetical protein
VNVVVMRMFILIFPETVASRVLHVDTFDVLPATSMAGRLAIAFNFSALAFIATPRGSMSPCQVRLRSETKGEIPSTSDILATFLPRTLVGGLFLLLVYQGCLLPAVGCRCLQEIHLGKLRSVERCRDRGQKEEFAEEPKCGEFREPQTWQPNASFLHT